MKLKKPLAIFLSVVLIFCSLPIVTLAEEATTSEAVNMEVSSADISLSGTNSVGNMIAAELEEVTEQNQGSGNVVFSTQVEADSVYVEFSTAVSCTLFVGVYTEDATTMLASGYTEVTPEDKYAFVTLNTTSPDYFYVKAYLVDSEDYSPLSAVHNNTVYTKEMQEFLSKTTDDFEEEKVVNFDDDTSNNFAVLSDDVLIIDEESETNKVTYADNASQIYILENIDETVSSLAIGDAFTFNYNNETVIVKVGEISINDTTATILGADAKLEDVFDYVRIEDKTGITEDSVDPDSCGEGITFEGYTEPPSTYALRAININESLKRGAKFNINFWEKKTENENAGVSITGSVELSAVFSPKLYISLSYKHIELKFDYELTGGITVSGELKYKVPIAFLTFGITGVRAEITPDFVVSVGGSVSVTGTFLKGTLGYGWASDVGGINLCTTPEQDLEFKAEVTVFIGLCIDPTIKIMEGALAKATLESNLGIEATASLSDSVADHFDDSKKHDCSVCVEGEIFGKFDLKVNGDLLNCDKLSLEFTLLEKKIKLLDFYWSMSYGEFGFTTCPHMSYKLDVMVSDTTGKAISNAAVSINGSTYTTAKNGIISTYLPNGNYKVSASKDGSVSKEQSVYIKNDSKFLKLKLENGTAITSNSFSLGGQHSSYIAQNGDLYMWGSNFDGQLGDGTTKNSPTPKKIMSNVVSVSLGQWHSAAITKNGDLYMWGNNEHGQLGDGTTQNSATPKKIMSNVIAVSLRRHNSAVITKNGDLYTWGWNYWGQLGDGTTNDRLTPKKIMSSVESVILGSGHSAAMTQNGDLYMWGNNDYGQLGDGTTTRRLTPKKITSNILSVSLGFAHSSIITLNGDLYVWGFNMYGGVGDGTTTNCKNPKKIMSNVASVSLGQYSSAAITQNGSLYMWGNNWDGKIGDGTSSNCLTPKKIMNNIATVVLGDSHSGAITKIGELYMWGSNLNGILGDGTYENRSTPKRIALPATIMLTARLYNSAPSSSVSEETSFENLEPNTIYNFYIMKDKVAESALSSGNLLYLTQGITDANGNVSFNFMNTGEDFNNAQKFVVKFKNVLPDNSVSNMVITASPQKIFLNISGNSLLNSGYENIKVKFTVNDEETYISEYSVVDDKMIFSIDTSDKFTNDSVISIKLLADYKGETYECKEYHRTLGDSRTDINSNGDTDLQDVTLMAQYLAGWSVSVNEQTIDTYGDGSVNLNDLITLAQYVAGWNVDLTANH